MFVPQVLSGLEVPKSAEVLGKSMDLGFIEVGCVLADVVWLVSIVCALVGCSMRMCSLLGRGMVLSALSSMNSLF